jgi:alkylation response protein AidB-like acyl-CoA dehydrogenase
MALYRIYTLTFEGKVVASPHIIDCVDDREAVHLARGYLEGHPIEVWFEARRVARINVDE